ncbi:nucleolar protein 12-domain-containing protein [Xylogone sp. PMI_703]|nr:nucleolar protein 12-domain-containing protein [Xylogone sp. PMI_703]
MPEIQVFRPPRPKKSVLPPPSKKRKTTSSVEEINFDFSAREEFLTGFHKRKLHRVKMAQEEAARKEREERIRTRKQLREERKQELEDHIKAVNAALKATTPGMASDEENEDEEGWNGIEENEDNSAAPELLDHEEEYIDEDKYTTVTVEEVDIDKNGIHKVADEEDDSDEDHKETEVSKPSGKEAAAKKIWPKKQKKKKFRYETKLERKLTLAKQKASKKAKAKARKGEE